jgi:hypothetical protein
LHIYQQLIILVKKTDDLYSWISTRNLPMYNHLYGDGK